MKKRLVFALLLAIGFMPLPAMADLIDFETGFIESNGVGTVATATNQVSFFVRKNASGGTSGGNIAAVGGTTAYAFPSAYGNDTVTGGSPGNYFLTDRNPQSAAESYFIQFLNPVTSLGLDLYDWDNGSSEPTLTVYSGTVWNGDQVSFGLGTTPAGDGTVSYLHVDSAPFPIYSASLAWVGISVDDETGIDNVSFTTAAVPAPAAVWLFGSGLLFLAGRRKREAF